MWNVLILLFLALICSLIFLPVIDAVLEDPSKRIPALILGFGTLAIVFVLLSLPRRRWEEGTTERRFMEMQRSRDGSLEAPLDDRVSSLIELRSAVVRRVQVRRRIEDKDLRFIVQSSLDLRRLLDEESLEELVLEDPRYLAWKMEQGGTFLDAYERLLAKVEAWR
jgi:hypothetical protein